MKHLNKYIFEDNRIDLTDFIKDKATDDDIKRLYNTYVRISRKGDNESYSDKIKKWIGSYKIGKMANDKLITHSKTFLRAVLYACNEHLCYDNVFNLMDAQLDNKPNAFYEITFKDTILFDQICEHYEKYFGIPNGFFEEIFDTESAGEPVVGKGEFLLRLISQPPLNDKNEIITGGDVVINQIPVEVKNLSGIQSEDNKIKLYECSLGNSLKGSCQPIYDFLNKFVENEEDKINYNTISLAKNSRFLANNENIVKTIKKIKNIDINTLITELTNQLNNSFFFKEKKDGYFNNYSSKIKDAIDQLVKINTNDVNSAIRDFIKIFTVLYIILYCGSEAKNSNKKSYLCLIMSNKTFKFYDASLDFETLYNDATIPIYQIRYSSGKAYVQLKDNN